MRALAASALLLAAACAAPTPESRAVAFLSREVPAWPVANKCFSCHNSGDGVRALLAARRAGHSLEPNVLESSLRFLSRPEDWKYSGPEGPFSDRKLAAIQFAHALSSSAGGAEPLRRAADLVRGFQETDGSWAVDTGGLPGSPVTYGRTLATTVARRILARAGLDEPAARAGTWLRDRKPETPLDAAALLLDNPSRSDAFDLLRRSQGPHGGWGPYVVSPPESFDTAVAILALSNVPRADVMILRGRQYLASQQLPDGSWPETVRPPGAESYAQRISTTAWALLALLQTQREAGSERGIPSR
jgi:hypothetical protein